MCLCIARIRDTGETNKLIRFYIRVACVAYNGYVCVCVCARKYELRAKRIAPSQDKCDCIKQLSAVA